MVKADPTRNYYADLKVSPTASENEIRKAFRGLALQYHPDRNPGHETEFVTKFQEIQAAHEILCDQQQRQKYDNERKRYRNVSVPANTPNTPRTRPPPPPRNAYTTTTPSGSYYRAPPAKPTSQQQRPQPPPQYNSYAGGADRFTNKNFRTPPTAQRPADQRAKDAEARANVFTAWQKMKQPRAEEPRPYNPGAHPTPPNQNAQSQQHNPNGAPFGRSASARVPSSAKKGGFDPGTPGGDEGQARSAYRNYARPAPTPPSSTTPPHLRPHPPMQDTQSNEVPYAEANRIRTPYSTSTGGERTSMFEGLGRSASVRNSPNITRPNSSADPSSYSDSGQQQQRNSYGGRPTNPFPNMYADSSDESESEVLRGAHKQRVPPPPKNPHPIPPPTWSQVGFGGTESHQTSPGTVPSNFKSRSEESINMKFSPSDWHRKFEGSGDYFAPNMQKAAAARGRTSPTRGRAGQRNATSQIPPTHPPMGPPPAATFAQAQAQNQSFPIPPPPPGPPPNLNFPHASAPPTDAEVQATKFKAEEWASTFKEPTWVTPKETSPRRASEAPKRPKAARKGSVAQDKRTKAQEQAEAARPRYQASADDVANGEDDAMDIDSSTPEQTTGPTDPPSTALPNVQVNGSAPLPNGSASAPPSATTTVPPASGLNGLGSSLVDDEIFTAPQAGGLGMNGVSDALPFPSEPSSTHPTKPATAQKLKFPLMPKAPKLPVPFTQVFVDLYLQQFEQYVRDYQKAKLDMTLHFMARDTELETLDPRFCHNRGETASKLGFQSYAAKMKEDEQVLATWSYWHEEHMKALGDCEDVRRKSTKLYSNQKV